MQVRAIECTRQLLLRCGEALFLLQLLSQHHVTRLVQGFDENIKRGLVQLTFHQLVCSEEGDRLATQLVSALMEVPFLQFLKKTIFLFVVADHISSQPHSQPTSFPLPFISS